MHSQSNPRSRRSSTTDTRGLRLTTQALLIVGLLLVGTQVAHAGGSGMPWESVFDQVLQSVTGPVAKVVGTLAVVGAGLGLAFGEGGHLMRKGLWLVLGLSVAFSAGTFVLPMLGFAGGLLV